MLYKIARVKITYEAMHSLSVPWTTGLIKHTEKLACKWLMLKR